MARFDRSHTSSYSPSIVTMYRLRDIAIYWSPSIVTVAVSVAVCEIFSVKEWRDLENQVRGRSRSLKMAPFDKPHVTFYWSSIVTMAISCIVCEI